MDTLYAIFYFIIAIGLIISIHEFGHFWVARKVGVKVLKFSIGFGKTICSVQKNSNSTKYVLSAIPLGGYVKMVDEREDKVEEKDLAFAFNRQSLLARTAIVAAGPLFNILLAIILLWSVFMLGDTGIRPIVGTVKTGTLADKAGFIEGEEIIFVNDESTPTWNEAMSLLFSYAIQGEQEITVTVKNSDGINLNRQLIITETDRAKPKLLFAKLGLKPWSPELEPIIGELVENSAAVAAGLKTKDLIITADGKPINDWSQWVRYVKNNPEVPIQLIINRSGTILPITIIPERIKGKTADFGRIGASVEIPEKLINLLYVKHSLPATTAFIYALEKTWFYSFTTLKMLGKMIIGKGSVENLSGPIGIAQYAGQSAERGLIHFLKFLALVSISIGVLNLFPIPILDGGHLMFLAIEAIKGSPVSEKIQIYFQQIGIVLLMSIMLFAIFLDLERLV